MSISKPTSIKADHQMGVLSVVWGDGHASDYPFSLLRHACRARNAGAGMTG